jgi:hypothetical protein
LLPSVKASTVPEAGAVYAYQTDPCVPKQSPGSSSAGVAPETSSVSLYGAVAICVAASKSSFGTGGNGVVSYSEK